MKNINKDYLVTVNAKTATVSAPGAMSFYITDILTSNIFFQLVFSESNNPLISSYAPNEDASNYTLTLRVVKPNNEAKEIEVVLLDQNSNFFIADLTADFIDVLGTYKCECFIDTEINGRPERSTTNSFTYTVKPSIFSNAEDIIDTNYLSIDNIATKDYVNQVAFGGEIDLNGYVTDKELSDALANLPTGGESYDDSEIRDLIANKADTDHTHDEYLTEIPDIYLTSIPAEYITETELNDALANLPSGGESYDDTELRGLIADKADSDHTHDNYLTAVPAEYITETELNDALAGVGGSSDTLVSRPVSVSSNTLTLTTDKYQVAMNLTSDTTIVLPEVDSYTEIHLFFTPTVEVALTLPSAKYQNTPTIEVGKTYEFIFTYIGTWLAGVIVYG